VWQTVILVLAISRNYSIALGRREVPRERRDILVGASGRISFRQAVRGLRHRQRFDRWAVALVAPGVEPHSSVIRFDDEEHIRVQSFPSKRLATAEARRRNTLQRPSGPERWEARPISPEPTTLPDEARRIWRATFDD
jgi:hypothetical protein